MNFVDEAVARCDRGDGPVTGPQDPAADDYEVRRPRRLRVRRRAFPVFHKRTIEREYQDLIHPQQALNDLMIGSSAVLMLSVLVKMALATGARKAAAGGIICMLCMLVPLLTIVTNSNDYKVLRPRIMLFSVISTSYYACGVSSVLDDRPVSSKMLPLMLLIRSHVIVLFWSNLSMQLPFWRHALTHGAGLLPVLGTNWSRCRWALHLASLPWLSSFANAMRFLTIVQPPAANSFVASRVGECTVTVNFLQLLLGFVVPCYISLVLEIRSRQAFLQKRLDQRRHARLGSTDSLRSAGNETLKKDRLLWKRYLPALAVAIPACWRLSEAAAEHLRASDQG